MVGPGREPGRGGRGRGEGRGGGGGKGRGRISMKFGSWFYLCMACFCVTSVIFQRTYFLQFAADLFAISGTSSFVSGGTGNEASGYGSSVTGGDVNNASGWGASVSGGQSNEASEWFTVPPPIKNGNPVAPWDPTDYRGSGTRDGAEATGGGAILHIQCLNEIVRFCHEKLPVRRCLTEAYYEEDNKEATKEAFTTNNILILPSSFSRTCADTLFPCDAHQRFLVNNNQTELIRWKTKCESTRAFSPALTCSERLEAENLMRIVQTFSLLHNFTFWMAAGSTIGGRLYHAPISWDDDNDMYVLRKDLGALLHALERNGAPNMGGEEWRKTLLNIPTTTNNTDDTLDTAITKQLASGVRTHIVHKPDNLFKLYNHASPKAGVYPWSFPGIDLVNIFCSSNESDSCVEVKGKKIIFRYRIDDVFPLSYRPFGRLTLPFPSGLMNSGRVVENRYDLSSCVTPAWSHRTESNLKATKTPCKYLHFHPATVRIETESPFKSYINNRNSYTTGFEGFQKYTLESLVDGQDVLSQVLFDAKGNEVRRSYAPGLIDAGGAVTYTPPYYDDSDYPPLVPYFLEQREAYRHNSAERSGEDLNREVMPMLDRVQIVNISKKKRPESSNEDQGIKVLFWNAERGSDWETFASYLKGEYHPGFARNWDSTTVVADIVILNEMDWGMVRSGNTHTTQQLADATGMNYAYGVEFLELTNGNAKEIARTKNDSQKNLVGFHGNAVLSRYPIEFAEVIRLHPLYDKLYQTKKDGMDAGEQRLGGRMALFTVLRLDNDSPSPQRILVISAHSQCGSKQLGTDWSIICNRIRDYQDTISGVFLAGDICGAPMAQDLVQKCGGFLPLPATNEFDGKIPVASWAVTCPNGAKPKAYGGRGDWILGSTDFSVTRESLRTIHPSKIVNGKHVCLSDHSILKLEATLLP